MSSLFFQSSSLKDSGIYLFNKLSLESCCSSSSSAELRRRSAHFRQQTGLFIGGHLGDVSRGPSLFGDGGDGVADGGGESHSRGESFFLFSLFVRRLVFFVRVLLFLPLLLLESRR